MSLASFVVNFVASFVDEAYDEAHDKVFVTRCDGSWDRKTKCARSGPAAGGAGAGHLQNKVAHAATYAAAPLGARRMHGESRPAGVASLHRWARGPTSRNGTTPDNQRSLLRPLPAGVRSAPRWQQTQALPRALLRACAVGDVGGCSAQGKAEGGMRKNMRFSMANS